VKSVQCPVGFLPQKEFVDRVGRRDQITLRKEINAGKAGNAEQNDATSGNAHGRFASI
jgi:hypothetical protein